MRKSTDERVADSLGLDAEQLLALGREPDAQAAMQKAVVTVTIPADIANESLLLLPMSNHPDLSSERFIEGMGDKISDALVDALAPLVAKYFPEVVQ